MQKHSGKNAWEKSNDAYSLSIRLHTTKNHISVYFLPQYQRQRKCFFSEHELKNALRDTLTLIYHGKLANQIARLAAIVVKKIIIRVASIKTFVREFTQCRAFLRKILTT